MASVTSGYAGGTVPDPTYEQVCTGRTGHAEVVQVMFDEQVLSYHDLLTLFFAIHDPTTVDRQGADVGTQYRSIVLCHDAGQQATAVQVIREIEGAKLWRGKIVTQVVPLGTFYPAEAYHRDYFRKHPEQAYCRMVIEPKVAKFRSHFSARLRAPADAATPTG